MLKSLGLPPGVSRNGTQRQNKGRWFDCNLVRWSQGYMQPVGGWERTSPAPLGSKVAGLAAWWTGDRNPRIAMGCIGGLYTFETEGSLKDITPEGFQPGRGVASIGNGYGAAEYNTETYNTARTEGNTDLTLKASNWSLDSFGNFLVGCMDTDGRAYYWDPETERALVVPNAPQLNRAVLTTAERHLMLIGAGGERNRIAWSDRENIEGWDFADATTLAGFLNLQTDGRLQTAVKVGGDVLVLSDIDAFRVSYVGAQLVYGSERVGTACGVAGPRAVAVADNFAVWMGLNDFYIFDGYVKALPCDVWDWVFRNVNRAQFSQVVAGHNPGFSEVWWFFASGAGSNDRYVIYNYRSGHWSIGYIGRDAWLDNGVLGYPLAAAEDRNLYRHEVGYLADGKSRFGSVWATTAPMELGEGNQILHVTRLLPDSDAENTTRLEFSFDCAFAPTTKRRKYGPYREISEGFINTRFSGRQAAMTVSAWQDGPWRFSDIRLDIKGGGLR